MHSWATRPLVARVEHRVVRRQAAGDVVGGEDGHLGGPPQAVGAHHRDVDPRDGQDARRAARGRRRRRRRRSAGPASGTTGWSGRNGRQVGPHRHRARPRATAAVGDAEGLVQVEVADVGAERAGPGQADEGVEVGAVDVHLAAGVVHERADLADALLEHAVGRGVGDHRARPGRSPCSATLARRSSRSTLPSSSQATTTTRMPAMTALAALVPWAEAGMRQTSRSASPRLRW